MTIRLKTRGAQQHEGTSSRSQGGKAAACEALPLGLPPKEPRGRRGSLPVNRPGSPIKPLLPRRTPRPRRWESAASAAGFAMLCGGAGTSPRTPQHTGLGRTGKRSSGHRPPGQRREESGTAHGVDASSGPERAPSRHGRRRRRRRKGHASARHAFYSADGGSRGPIRSSPGSAAAAAPSSGASRPHRAAS